MLFCTGKRLSDKLMTKKDKVMTQTKSHKYFKTRALWRRWLAKNHKTKKEIWLLYYKKHTGKPSMVISEGVEEALCYGWIDTTLKRLDDERFILRYTPRRKGSVWSDVNKDRVKKLIKKGKMTKAGLEAIKGVDLDSREIKLSELDLGVPSDFKKALGENEAAKKGFISLAPSYKKMYIWWITSAKHPETRAARIERSLKAAEKGYKYPTMT